MKIIITVCPRLSINVAVPCMRQSPASHCGVPGGKGYTGTGVSPSGAIYYCQCYKNISVFLLTSNSIMNSLSWESTND